MIAINVTNSIALFENSCKSLDKVGTLIINLPLVIYRDGAYQTSNEARNGYTIGERVNIVKKGNSTGNTASCIRLSSNWICSTAHKYIVSLGFPAPFDIFNL